MTVTSGAPLPPWQPLFERLPGCTVFDGALTGRRLLAVWALREQGRRYPSELDADSFWLALSGDAPGQVVWLRPDWIVDFFDKTWQLLPRAVSVQALGAEHSAEPGTSPALRQMLGDVWRRPADGQHVQGLMLRQIEVAHGHAPHVAALALRLAASASAPSAAQPVQPALAWGGASLLFDMGAAEAEDLDVTALLTSPDAGLGQWPLRRDVLERLVSTPQAAVPWCDTPAPWNAPAHLATLCCLRAQWQGWLADAVPVFAGRLPLAPRMRLLQPLFNGLKALAVFEIALTQGQMWHDTGSSWLDRDGDDYGPHWASLSAWPTHQSLAEDLWAVLQTAWPLVTPDRFKAAWQGAGLDLKDPATDRRASALAGVWEACGQWWPLFQQAMARGKVRKDQA